MIQRIQTVYLLLALALSVILFFVPFYHFANNPEAVIASLNKYLVPVVVIICLECIAAIFLFKNRSLQKNICRLLIITLLGYLVIGLVFIKRQDSTYMDIHSFGLGFILPVISIIFTLLAIRNINKDEELIKSMDRLR